MASKPNDSIAAEMAKLRNEFHQRLLVELEEFVTHASLSDQELSRTETLKKLYQASHRLAGSALTFGYSDTGALLRRFESVLDMLVNRGGKIDVDALRRQLNELAPAVAIPPAMSSSADVPQDQSKESAKDRPPVENKHIFVLEDKASENAALRTGLSSFGYKVSVFTEISTLCEAALLEHPDGLIVDTENSFKADQGMATVARRLREIGKGSVPIILVSQHDSFEEKLEAARNSVVAFLSKPVNIPALESQLDHVLQRHTKSPYRVLLVDDDVYSMEHHRLLLEKWGFMARALADPSKIIETIDEYHPELMIFDLHMPSCTGIELAEVVRFHTNWLHIPILFLSSKRDESRQMTAMMTGGNDFIVKPVVEESFVATIMSRAQRARQLAELMTRDSLTGLLKHTEIKERLAYEFARTQRNGSTLCVAMVDIDKFKRVNDNYGHQTGDVVIATLAHLLRRSLRTTDIVGRYGGEEYLLVMPDTNY